jgi:hypothetical protein
MPFDDKIDNVIVINSDPDGLMEKLLNSMSKSKLVEGASHVDPDPVFAVANTALGANNNTLNHPIMKKLLADPNTRFDAVIVSNLLLGEAGYYLACLFVCLFVCLLICVPQGTQMYLQIILAQFYKFQ